MTQVDIEPPQPAKSGARRRKLTNADKIVGVLVLACIAWYLQAEIPTDAHRHFVDLDEVEFLTLEPGFDFVNGDVVVSQDQGLGFAHGSLVVGSRTIRPDEVMGKVRWADRFYRSPLGFCACFNPQYAIRGLHNHDNIILLDFNCSRCNYNFDGEQYSASIAGFSRKWFANLALSPE